VVASRAWATAAFLVAAVPKEVGVLRVVVPKVAKEVRKEVRVAAARAR